MIRVSRIKKIFFVVGSVVAFLPFVGFGGVCYHFRNNTTHDMYGVATGQWGQAVYYTPQKGTGELSAYCPSGGTRVAGLGFSSKTGPTGAGKNPYNLSDAKTSACSGVSSSSNLATLTGTYPKKLSCSTSQF